MEFIDKSEISVFKKKRTKNEASAKQVFRDFGIYLVFLLVTTIVTISSREIGMFYFNNTIERLLLNRLTSNKHGFEIAYEDLVTIADWWSFVETALIESISKFETNISKRNGSSDGNVLLGPPRLRQIRVKSDICKVNKIFENEFNTCFGDYMKSKEDVSHFQSKDHSSQEEAGTYDVSGTIASYHGGGYIQMLPLDTEENEEILGQLKEESWVDPATRLILIEFSLFNLNTNIFCNAKLLAEILPTGGLITSSQLRAFKYNPLWNDGEYFVITCSVIFFLLVLYFTLELYLEIMSKGCSTVFRSVFNMLHALVLLIAYITLAYITWHHFYLKSILKRYENDTTKYLSLDIICYWNRLFIDMMGICVFIVWIQFFKYIKFNKTMMQFSRTFQRCAKDLLGFSIMFAIVFVAFAFLAVMIFGSVHSDFFTFPTAILTLMRTVLGDFDYDKLEEANRILGPIFFLSFILFVFFILLNMFLAIINDTYSDVKSEVTQDRDDQYEEYMKTLFGKLKRNIFPRDNEDHEMPVDDPSISGISSKNQSTPEDKETKNMEAFIDKYFENVSIDRDVGDEESLTQRLILLEDKLENIVTLLEEILSKKEKSSQKKLI